MPPDAAVPRYGPVLLPPQEVYTVLRESGFSPLGVPQQRGLVYTISAIDSGGDDGRLVIDARTGRIIRFMPAYRMGDNLNEDLTVTYGPVGPLPPTRPIRGVPRPPASVPHVASRTPVVPIAKGFAGARRRSEGTRKQIRFGAGAAIGGGRDKARRAANPADAGNAEGAGAGLRKS